MYPNVHHLTLVLLDFTEDGSQWHCQNICFCNKLWNTAKQPRKVILTKTVTVVSEHFSTCNISQKLEQLYANAAYTVTIPILFNEILFKIIICIQTGMFGSLHSKSY